MWILAFLKGFGLSGSLIIAIGAQNAFVLGQALRRDHALTIGITCALLDAILILSGVLGLGTLIKQSPWLLQLVTYGGVLFLLVYGWLAFRRSLHPQHLDASRPRRFSSMSSAIAVTMAISLLNPHVYLDTVVLLGSIGGRLPVPDSYWFAAGAVCASLVWFLGLALGGKYLSPLLSEDRHWRRLDLLIALIMWSIAASLWFSHQG